MARRTETVYLPIGEKPKGRGWSILSGNTIGNSWTRLKPKKPGPTRDELVASIQKLLRQSLVQKLHGWTDYPFEELGDVPGVEAPVRACTVIGFDQDKYVEVIVDGVVCQAKYGYIYKQFGRLGAVPSFVVADFKNLPALSSL